MSDSQKLAFLGCEITRLSRILYGISSSPLEKTEEIAVKTGVKIDLIHAALLACEDTTILPQRDKTAIPE